MDDMYFYTLYKHFLNDSNDNDNLQIDYSNPFVSNLKISTDWYRLSKICSKLLYSEIERICKLIISKENCLISIVLVGSVARAVHSDKSDVDLLVILWRRKKINELDYCSPFKEINIVYRTKNDFAGSYKKGSEFFVWCVKYGLVLYDNNYFLDFYNQPLVHIRSDEVITKRSYVNNTVLRIYELLAKNDLYLGANLIKKISIQTARIILLSQNIIPKSRPELYFQLQSINSTFASIFGRLSNIDKMSGPQLSEYTDTVFKYLNDYIKDYYNE